jgi:choline kinase
MKLIVLAAGLGSRMQAVTNGRPKQLVEVGGMTLLARHAAMAEAVGMEPVVVTRPDLVTHFRRTGIDVRVEPNLTDDMLETLSNTRRWVRGPYAWVGGDMLIADFAPVRQIVEAHFAENASASFLYARTDRFKAKLTLAPRPQVLTTREGSHPFSVLNFGVHAPCMFAYMPGDPRSPRGNYLQRSLEGGEPVLWREYHAAAFEIDTPADLAEARRHFDLLARAS